MITNKWFRLILCFFILLNNCFIYAAKSEAPSVNDAGEILEEFSYESIMEFKETRAEYDARMQWWVDARFGQFVHWGPVTLTGKVIGWSRGGERRGEGGTGTIPVEVYDNLYKHFSPTEFDAMEWVKASKDAGTKYIIFLLKHHDGFCLWDTKTTDYKITSPLSPFGRDVAREIADACHELDMKLIWYFSLGDWYNPDYHTENHDRFETYTLEQIRELCTNYGKIDGFWFDLAYPKMHETGMPARVSNLIHHLQPGAIINNRGGLKADYDTPENQIGAFQVDRLWESCITLARNWSWNPNDYVKTFEECIYLLVNTVGGDGNLALNIGPMPDGRIDPKREAVLKEIGSWMDKYSESIYGTRGGPFMPGDFGSCTHKGSKIYLHVLNFEGDSISLPGLGKKIVGSSLLTGGEVKVEQSDDGIVITVAKRYHKKPDTIMVLEIEGQASDIKPILTASGSIAFGREAKASSSLEGHDASKAFDGDDKSSWSVSEKEGWLEVDLGKVKRVARTLIYESNPGNVKGFELQCKVEEKWENVYEGIELGAQVVIRFAPVEGRYFRLNILEAEDKVSIAEFKLTGTIGSADKEYMLRGTVVSDEVWMAGLDRWVKIGGSSVCRNMRQYGPDKIVEGGRWLTNSNVDEWLDIDFGKERTIDGASLKANRHWLRIKEFEFQKRVNGKWETFYRDEAPEANRTLKPEFEAVTVQHVRFKIKMKQRALLQTTALRFFDAD